MPEKPPAPTPTGTQTQLLSKSTTSPTVYKGFLDSDAALAGVVAPTIVEMSRKLPYRSDEARHVLELGKPPIEAAGLKLRIERTGNQVIMVIESQLAAAAAYRVNSAPNSQSCDTSSVLPFNAMVIGKGETERRTECAWRDGMTIAVTKVETMELLPLEAWYLSQLPPVVAGLEDRIARGHRGVDAAEKCSPVLPSVVRTGVDRGEIGWRDLVDFYSRHRCQTYQFPASYRAFTRDNERSVPATGN